MSEKYVLTFQDYEQMETDFLLIHRQKLAIFVLPNNQNFELVLKYLNVLQPCFMALPKSKYFLV